MNAWRIDCVFSVDVSQLPFLLQSVKHGLCHLFALLYRSPAQNMEKKTFQLIYLKIAWSPRTTSFSFECQGKRMLKDILIYVACVIRQLLVILLLLLFLSLLLLLCLLLQLFFIVLAIFVCFTLEYPSFRYLILFSFHFR